MNSAKKTVTVKRGDYVEESFACSPVRVILMKSARLVSDALRVIANLSPGVVVTRTAQMTRSVYVAAVHLSLSVRALLIVAEVHVSVVHVSSPRSIAPSISSGQSHQGSHKTS